MGSDLLVEVLPAVHGHETLCYCLGHGRMSPQGPGSPVFSHPDRSPSRKEFLELLIRIFSFPGTQSLGNSTLPSSSALLFTSFCSCVWAPDILLRGSLYSALPFMHIEVGRGQESGCKLIWSSWYSCWEPELQDSEASDFPLTFQSLPLPPQFCPAVAN